MGCLKLTYHQNLPSLKVAHSNFSNERKSGAECYRYGFQGQEKDDELKGEGNSVNYKYRMHDPRIGRFFAIDPLAPKYPFYSPYSFSGNRVIDAVELEGLEPLFVNDENGNLVFNSDDWEPVLKVATSIENEFVILYSNSNGVLAMTSEDRKKLSTDPQFNGKVRETFISSGTNALKGDLTQKKVVTFWEGGNPQKTQDGAMEASDKDMGDASYKSWGLIVPSEIDTYKEEPLYESRIVNGPPIMGTVSAPMFGNGATNVLLMGGGANFIAQAQGTNLFYNMALANAMNQLPSNANITSRNLTLRYNVNMSPWQLAVLQGNIPGNVNVSWVSTTNFNNGQSWGDATSLLHWGSTLFVNYTIPSTRTIQVQVGTKRVATGKSVPTLQNI